MIPLEVLGCERDVARAGRVVDVSDAELERAVATERGFGAPADRARGVSGRIELVGQHDLARIEGLVKGQRDVDEMQLPRGVLDRIVDAARERGLRDDGADARVERRQQHDLGADHDVGPQRDAVGQAGRREHAPVVADVVARREERRAPVLAAELKLRAVDELIETAQPARSAAGTGAKLAPLRGRAAAVESREQMIARQRIVAARARIAAGRVGPVVRIAVVGSQRAAVGRAALQRVGGVVGERGQRLAHRAGAVQRDPPAARVRPVRLPVGRIRDPRDRTRTRAHQPRDERLAQVGREEKRDSRAASPHSVRSSTAPGVRPGISAPSPRRRRRARRRRAAD